MYRAALQPLLDAADAVLGSEGGNEYEYDKDGNLVLKK